MADDLRMIWPWSNHGPNMNSVAEVIFQKRILYGKFKHFRLRLADDISPRAGRATKSDAPISSNAAPARNGNNWRYVKSNSIMLL